MPTPTLDVESTSVAKKSEPKKLESLKGNEPRQSRDSRDRWGAVIFCGDSDGNLLFCNSVKMISDSLTSAVGIKSVNISLFYHGPTNCSLIRNGIGSKVALKKAMQIADQTFEVLFLVILGHNGRNAKGDRGIICLDGERHLIPDQEKAFQDCQHATLKIVDAVEMRKALINTSTNVVLTPQELSEYLSEMQNCESHVVVHSCSAGIFKSIENTPRVASFTSATNLSRPMLIRLGNWREPASWSKGLDANTTLQPIRKHLKAAYDVMNTENRLSGGIFS